MANARPYQLIQGTLRRGAGGSKSRLLQAGAVFVPTDAELRAFGDVLRPAPVPEAPKPAPPKDEPKPESAQTSTPAAPPQEPEPEPQTEPAQTTAQSEPPANDSPEPRPVGGSWYALPDGSRIQGREKAFEAWRKQLAGR